MAEGVDHSLGWFNRPAIRMSFKGCRGVLFTLQSPSGFVSFRFSGFFFLVKFIAGQEGQLLSRQFISRQDTTIHQLTGSIFQR